MTHMYPPHAQTSGCSAARSCNITHVSRTSSSCADVCVLCREILQIFLEGQILAYFADFWNIIDWVSTICFVIGFCRYGSTEIAVI